MARHLRRPREAERTKPKEGQDTDAPAPVQSAQAPAQGRRVRRGTLNLRPKSAGIPDAVLAAKAIMARGRRARTNVEDFYDLVIREETTRERLTVAPHQRVMFSFVSHHDRCVFRQPIGTAKTYSMATLAMHLLGRDSSKRGMITSAAQDMAARPLGMVRNYISQPELNARLALVFPNLRQSTLPGDPWTTEKITVQREPGIRDASLRAVGMETKFQGARLAFLFADDVVNSGNSMTKEARAALKTKFMTECVSRLDRHFGSDSLAVVTNTPWDREDLTYYLEKEAGWATVVMDIYGNLRFTNASAAWLHLAEQEGLIRSSRFQDDVWRLAQHDPDPDETIPLWPERFPLTMIEKERKAYAPHDFARLYLCEPFEADAQRCQKDWVEKCKRLGMGTTLALKYSGNNPTFMGVDLGIGQGRKNDKTVFFVFEVEPDGRRRILWVESGRWSGPDIVDKLIDLYDRYQCVAAVENNQAQEYLRQFALEKRKDLQVHAHTTNHINKNATDFGVESIFTEVKNVAWIIPCDFAGVCEPEVQKWIDDMLFYQPNRHTGDYLMASWIARERARKNGFNDPEFRSTAKSDWIAQSRASGF